jgi:hypothetical protein
MLRGFLVRDLGYVASQLIEFALIVLILFILVFPVYFVMKKFRLGPSRWHRDTTIREEILEAVTWRTRPEDYARSPLARNLHEVGTNLRTVYEWFLGFMLVAATVFIFEFFKNLHDDANRAFLEAYFGIGYMVVFLFTVGQITVIESEKRSRKETLAKVSRLEKRQFKETDVVLAEAAAYLKMGEPIDMVAGHINVYYREWAPMFSGLVLRAGHISVPKPAHHFHPSLCRSRHGQLDTHNSVGALNHVLPYCDPAAVLHDRTRHVGRCPFCC